jgi:molybdopterin molybdotransferase
LSRDSDLITLDEARGAIRSLSPVAAETVEARHAAGRVTAEDLYSPVDLPHFERAAMDGYAVKSADTKNAASDRPAVLQVIGAVEMGKRAVRPVESGTAIAISTGGMLPPGGDAVVMLEETQAVGGMIEIRRPASPGLNVIRVGDDIQKGVVVFRRGRRLKPHDLGALTGMGVSSLAVYRKPKVALISIGDELVDPDREPTPGQVRNINRYALGALIEASGAELRDLGIIRDQAEPLRAALQKALVDNDLVLLSGGSSVGARDITRDTILSLPAAKLFFHGVAISPGRPTIFAAVDGKPVVGLPGYPVSALLVFDLFASLLIRALGGEEIGLVGQVRKTVRARLKAAVRSSRGREDYVRVSLERLGNTLYATPLRRSSGAISTLVKADGMIRIDLNDEGAAEGEEVEVILF